MRELRGAGKVEVCHIPTEQNPADLFTKVLGRQVFEKHRATVLNTQAKGSSRNSDACDGADTKFVRGADKVSLSLEER